MERHINDARPSTFGKIRKVSSGFGNGFRLAISSIAVLCASSVAGVVLLTAVYALPVDPMREHARCSIPLYEKEGIRPEWSGGGLRKTRHFTRLDNAVEMMMTCIATTPSERPPLQSAMLNEKPSMFNSIAEKYPLSLSDGNTTELVYDQYARYWHGYLVFLKPMLLFWTPQEIRIVNAAFILFCFCFACLAAKERFGTAGLFAFFAASLFLNPVSACLSLQYTASFSLSALGFAFVCRHAEWLCDGVRIAFFFLAVGILIVFFDFLTFPLATWGLPLAALLLSLPEKTFGSVAKAGGLSAFWLVGYAGMWASKWVVASLFTGINVVRDAAEQSAYRMTGTTWAGIVDGPRALAENWNVFARTPVLPFFVLSFLVIAAFLFRNRSKVRWRNWPCALGLMAVAAAPVVWIFVLQNHSFVHAYMVSKISAVTAFALLAIPLCLFETPVHRTSGGILADEKPETV